MKKGHLYKLPVFRYLTNTATENNERSKGTTTSKDSSGTEGAGVEIGVAVGVEVGAGVGVEVGKVGV